MSKRLWCFPVPWRIPSAIETHVVALIQVHVGVTKETFGNTFHVSRRLAGQLSRRHFQVPADLRAGVNLRYVEAVALSWTQHTQVSKILHVHGSACNETMHEPLTLSVCHAVKEDPVLDVGSMLDEGHIVAGLDTEHSEQLQFVSGQSLMWPAIQVALREVQRNCLMWLTLRMTVHLEKNTCFMYYTHAIWARCLVFYDYKLLKHYSDYQNGCQ